MSNLFRDPSEEDDGFYGFGMPSPNPPTGRRLVGVKTPLGFGRALLQRDGTLGVRIGGQIRPLHHFGSAELTPVYARTGQRQADQTGGAESDPSSTPQASSAPGPRWNCTGTGAERACVVKSDKKDIYGPAAPGVWNDGDRTHARGVITDLEKLKGGEQGAHIVRRNGKPEMVVDGSDQGTGLLTPRILGGRGTVSMHNHDRDGWKCHLPEWKTSTLNDAVTLDSPLDPGGPGGLSMLTCDGIRTELYVDQDGVLTGETLGYSEDDDLDALFEFLNRGQKELGKRARKRHERKR